MGQWLDKLDRESDAGLHADKRRGERFRYRLRLLALQLPAPGQHTISDEETPRLHAATPRNISKYGLALLVEQFVYPGTPCAVWLRSPHGLSQRISGRVVRCRYVLGSACVHEIGVRFGRPIDVEVFSPDAVRLRIVVADPTSEGRRLLAGLLDGARAELQFAATFDEALRQVAPEVDALLVELDEREFDALQLAQQARAQGYLGPIVALTARSSEQTAARCTAAGITGYMPKPLVQPDLHALLDSLREAPLVSTVANDPAMVGLIDEYIVQLRAWMSELARAHDAPDVAAAAGLAQKLRATGGSYGFAAISQEAAYLEGLIAAERSQDEVRTAIRGVMDLCRRARPAPHPLDARAWALGAAGREHATAAEAPAGEWPR